VGDLLTCLYHIPQRRKDAMGKDREGIKEKIKTVKVPLMKY